MKTILETRPGTYDDYVMTEIERTYGWMDVKDKVCVDVGACFGATTAMFADKGAKLIVSIEPDEDNFRMLTKNTAGMPVHAIRAAAVQRSYEGESATFYLNQRKNRGAHSLFVSRGRPSVTVPIVRLQEVLEKFQPEVLKVDCEGSEYPLLLETLPPCVKQLTAELHFGKRAWRNELAPAVLEKLKDDGWLTKRSPILTGGYWFTWGGWQRA